MWRELHTVAPQLEGKKGVRGWPGKRKAVREECAATQKSRRVSKSRRRRTLHGGRYPRLPEFVIITLSAARRGMIDDHVSSSRRGGPDCAERHARFHYGKQRQIFKLSSKVPRSWRRRRRRTDVVTSVIIPFAYARSVPRRSIAQTSTPLQWCRVWDFFADETSKIIHE